MSDYSMQQTPSYHNQKTWVDAVVTMERPPRTALARADRRKKLEILEENARQHRTELVQWIEEHGLATEVATVGDATRFNLLFVKCTPKVARALKKAPGVVAVTMADGAATLMDDS
jgi:phage gp46-like protein